MKIKILGIPFPLKNENANEKDFDVPEDSQGMDDYTFIFDGETLQILDFTVDDVLPVYKMIK